MSLQDWLRSGWLTEHQTSPREVDDLLRVVDRDLKDCKAAGLSPDWRFNIAYNAALQAATAALAATGFRAVREAHHFRVIQSLAETIRADAGLVTRLDFFRKKRNVSGYERVGSISDRESDEMLDCALEVRQRVVEWLKANHPELISVE